MRRWVQYIGLLLAAQVGLAGLLLTRGFPWFGSGLVGRAPWWELPVAIYHLPAIQALSTVGLCCGLHNGAVLPSRVIGGHIPMRLSGALILAFTNWACWSAFTLLLGAIWWWQRRRLTPVAGETEAA